MVAGLLMTHCSVVDFSVGCFSAWRQMIQPWQEEPLEMNDYNCAKLKSAACSVDDLNYECMKSPRMFCVLSDAVRYRRIVCKVQCSSFHTSRPPQTFLLSPEANVLHIIAASQRESDLQPE